MNDLWLRCALPCSAVADTGDVLLSPAIKRPLSEEDVVSAVGQLGDNTLAPADIDVSGLNLDQGECFLYVIVVAGKGVCV
jgi:hypothetical protein